jgi:hypothetical protein
VQSDKFTTEQLEALVSRGVEQAFVRLGIQVDDPIEMQRDFQHLREWRMSMQLVKRRSIIGALGLVAAGLGTLFWLGIKAFISNP